MENTLLLMLKTRYKIFFQSPTPSQKELLLLSFSHHVDTSYINITAQVVTIRTVYLQQLLQATIKN